MSMKKIVLLVCLCCLFITTVHAQTLNEEKVNKAADIFAKMITNPDQMMTLYQEMQALKLTPAEEKEAQKRAQQQAISNTKKIVNEATATGGKSAEQIKQMRENNKRIVPLRDEARISSVIKRNLNEAEVKSFCKAVHESVKKTMLPQAVEQAEKLFAQIKTKASTPEAQGKEAVAAYLSNLTLQSLYIMGRICSETNADANTLNNYAALLNSFNMEQGAIPILNHLRVKYGASPPVMNNLAMAWLGLGEFQKAGKIADTVIQRFHGRRGQSHYVKAIIKEGEGDRPGAVKEMEKSMDESFSSAKENMLKQWNGNQKRKNIRLKQVGDKMGLDNHLTPAFPQNYEEYMRLKPVWQQYHRNIDAAIEQKQILLTKLKTTAYQKINASLGTKNNGYAASINNTQNRAAQEYAAHVGNKFAEAEKEIVNGANNMVLRLRTLKDAAAEVMKKVMKPFEKTCGEGQPCPEKEICNAQKRVWNEYLASVKEIKKSYYDSALNVIKFYINQIVNAEMYVMDEHYFPVFQMEQQLYYLAYLKSIDIDEPGSLFSLDGKPKCVDDKNNPFEKHKLADFDEVNCKSKWFMAFPGGHELSTECNKLTFKVNFLIASVARTENLVIGEWNEFEIEAGLDVGSKQWGGGAVEVGAEVGGYVKIDRSGVNDWGAKAGAGIKAGNETVKVGTKEINLGVKMIEVSGKVSMVSGKVEGEMTSDFSSNKIEWK
jgi:hypothetical protein